MNILMAVKDKVLAALEQARGERLSGGRLAETLGVSRAAVHKAISTLRADGLAIDGVPGEGYRLACDDDSLTAAGVMALLQTRCIGREIVVVPSITSTNTVMKEQYLDRPHGFVLAAEEQTGGRGRLGRTFVSPSGILDGSKERIIALVGVGNLGRAILSYFTYSHPGLTIAAAFDTDENKVDRVISGCRCFHMSQFESKIAEMNINLGIITVPATQAQFVADRMIAANIKGILNFAPVPLKVPEGVFVDRIDIASSLEKLAYFADLA